MGENEWSDPRMTWTNERHAQFLNSIEASFVRRMLEGDGFLLLRMDRYLPDRSESTRDSLMQWRRNHSDVAEVSKSRRGDKNSGTRIDKSKRRLSPQPHNSSEDQVVPQM